MTEEKDQPLHLFARRARVRRTARPWRIAFALYAIALTTGTHWPKLALAPEVPASDKVIHLLAFAGLTVLLWRTRWISSLWVLGIIAVCWAGADEISQGIPVLNRTVSWHDVAANLMGVLAALVWLWALGPVGAADGANRARLRVQEFVIDEMFARLGPWLALAGGIVAGALPLWMLWRSIPQPMLHIAVVVALVVAAVVTLAIWVRMWQRLWDDTHTAMPCLACGARGYCLDFRNISGGRCDKCGSDVSATQWIDPGHPSAAIVLSMTFKPAVIGTLVLVLGFGLILATPLIYEQLIAGGSSMRWVPRMAQFVGSLPVELTSAIDLGAYLLLLAVVVRVYRTGLGRWHDRALRCRRCGHDLRGTPTMAGTQGVGRCGECGTPFVRAIESKAKAEPQKHTGAEKHKEHASVAKHGVEATP